MSTTAITTNKGFSKFYIPKTTPSPTSPETQDTRPQLPEPSHDNFSRPNQSGKKKSGPRRVANQVKIYYQPINREDTQPTTLETRPADSSPSQQQQPETTTPPPEGANLLESPRLSEESTERAKSLCDLVKSDSNMSDAKTAISSHESVDSLGNMKTATSFTDFGASLTNLDTVFRKPSAELIDTNVSTPTFPDHQSTTTTAASTSTKKKWNTATNKEQQKAMLVEIVSGITAKLTMQTDAKEDQNEPATPEYRQESKFSSFFSSPIQKPEPKVTTQMPAQQHTAPAVYSYFSNSKISGNTATTTVSTGNANLMSIPPHKLAEMQAKQQAAVEVPEAPMTFGEFLQAGIRSRKLCPFKSLEKTFGMPESMEIWYYVDHSGNEQGPFTSEDMDSWYYLDYFEDTLQITCIYLQNGQWYSFKDLLEYSGKIEYIAYLKTRQTEQTSVGNFDQREFSLHNKPQFPGKMMPSSYAAQPFDFTSVPCQQRFGYFNYNNKSIY